MKEKKKLANTMAGHSFSKWVNVMGVIAGLIALVATCVNYLNNQKADTDRKIETKNRQIDTMDRRLGEAIEKLDKTADLVHADMLWRYLYQNHPVRKKFVPLYHPETRTIEFVDTSATSLRRIRKP
jgi:hypothetical protein